MWRWLKTTLTATNLQQFSHPYLILFPGFQKWLYTQPALPPWVALQLKLRLRQKVMSHWCQWQLRKSSCWLTSCPTWLLLFQAGLQLCLPTWGEIWKIHFWVTRILDTGLKCLKLRAAMQSSWFRLILGFHCDKQEQDGAWRLITFLYINNVH
jgi:hypothetical protein